MNPTEHYLPNDIIALLKRQHYALFGHSAAKLCHWTKRSLYPGDSVCYKQKFYGISSHRCLQMTPAVAWCQQQCSFCWRPLTKLKPQFNTYDSPEEIVQNSIEMQRVLLSGYGALEEEIGAKKLEEAQNPNQVAISLSGEPTLYPKISELIDAYKQRKFSTFLVSNGMLPETLASMSLPTQLYLSLEAPNEQLHKKINSPAIPNSWKTLNKSLELLPSLKARTALRLTLMRDINMSQEKEFAELIEKASPDFLELKAYMFVGFSRERLKKENMPLHEEVMEFAKKIEENTQYKITDSSKPSRVALLTKKDSKPTKITN